MRKVLLVVGVILSWITAAQSRGALISGRFRLPPASSTRTNSNNPSTPPGADAEGLAANSEGVLAITSYSPQFGPPGTVVTIQGTGFGPSSASSCLSVMSPRTGTWTTWPTTNWSDTEITAAVPATMQNGLVYLNVTVNGLQSIGTEPFTVGVPPNIGSYSPQFGSPGTVLTIHGTGFGASRGSSFVSVYSTVTGLSTTWKPTSWSDTEIVVPAPATIPNGLVYLSVTVDGLASIGTYPYTVGIPPVITSYAPLFGLPGTVLTIQGTGFGASQGSSFVSIYSTVTGLSSTWRATSWTDTEVTALVPSNITNGQVYLGVNVKGLQSIGTSGFRVGIPPVISSYSPGFGEPGTVLTIHGSGFGPTQGDSYLRIQSTVTGTYTTWPPTSWSDTEIVALVPTNMPLGKGYLSVEVNEVKSFGWNPFTVGVPPLIASYSPFSGAAGTVLTIHGTGFGASQGSGNVSVYSGVNNTSTIWKPTSWSDTEIIVPTPATMPNGLVYLSVTADKLTNIGTYPYTVGIPPVVTTYFPQFGPSGTVLTIHGTGFGGSQGSSFVSFYSTVTGLSTTWKPTSWSDTEIVVPAPATMPNGLAYLAVTVDGLANIGTYPYTVGTPPAVTSYSPQFGPSGTVLTIHGTGFGGSQGSSFVSFYSTVTGLSTTWKPTSWSDTEIVVPAPAAMPNGLAYLAVTVDGLANIGTYPYTVGTPPVVTSYSPQFGPAGTMLTIHGTGFGASQGSSFVSFYSTVTGLSTTWKPTSWSDTEIVVPAPATMPNGLAYLSVTVDGLANIGTYPYNVQ